MAEDKLYSILYQMVKYDWHNLLCKLGNMPTDMSIEDLVNYFEQIKLLKGMKQKSRTIIVDDNSDTKKKLSSHCNNKTKLTGNAKGRPPTDLKEHPANNHIAVEDLYISNLKLAKKLKK
eukprot:9956636-Ditylum_brightwellii.AAC.1